METKKIKIQIDNTALEIELVITERVTSNSVAFLEIVFYISKEKFLTSKGWRLIVIEKGDKRSLKLDAPAYPTKFKFYKSIFLEPVVYQKITNEIYPIFRESLDKFITDSDYKNIGSEEQEKSNSNYIDSYKKG